MSKSTRSAMPAPAAWELVFWPSLAILLLAACGPGHPRARGVVLVCVDTLRADQLGAYGGRAGTTPALDALAEEALVFERAYAQATFTHASVTSMLSGLQPQRHGIRSQSGRLFAEVVPVAARLQARGVETGCFVANLCKLLEVDARTVWNEGWDHSHCGLGMDESREQWEWDDDVVDAALQWIVARPGPFLAWVHLMDPHAEHRPPPEHWDWDADPPLSEAEQYRAFNAWEIERGFPPPAERERLWALYRAEVRGVDDRVGRLLAGLDALPPDERPAVVFASDHGEELYETWSRFDHGYSLSEGVLRVPLLVRAPGLAPGRVAEPVELLQVAPTLLALLGAEVPTLLDGPSLLSAEPSRGLAVSSAADITLTARDATHRYWFRISAEPWTRPPNEAPWRADAPWFRERELLADFDPRDPNRPRWADPRGPAQAPRVRVFAEALEPLVRLALTPRAEEIIEDPGLAEQLEHLGYAGREE